MALLGGSTVRLLLTITDPDAVFRQALAAGAKQIYPVSEGHGWRVCFATPVIRHVALIESGCAT